MSLDVELRVGHNVVFEWNITHNLAAMAKRAGAYEAAWRPDENGVDKARDVLTALEPAIFKMIREKSSMEVLSPDNGWGTYSSLLLFLCEYAAACHMHPYADVWVSR